MNMNRKKSIVFLFVLLIFSLFLNLEVYAADCSKYGCAKCVYSENSFKFTYDLQSSGDGSAELRFSYEVLNGTTHITYKLDNSLVARNFITSENKLFCPSNLYVHKSAGGRTVAGEIKTTGSDNQKASLSSESTNNNLLVVEEGSTASRSCSYNWGVKPHGSTTVKVTISVVNNALKYELSDGFVMGTSNSNPLKVEDFQGETCPEIYGSCGCYQNDCYCAASKSNDFSILEVPPSQGTEEETITQPTTKNPYAGSTNSDLDNTVVGENFCSDKNVVKVLRLAGYAIVLAKIIVPLILIVLGTIDLYKAVVGKDSKDLTNSAKALMFRVALGVFIFFIPTIVNWFVDTFYDTVGGDNNKQCINCVLNVGSC